MPNQMTDVDRVLHALADPTRRVLVERLGQGPTSVSELAKPLPMSLPAVLQHLQVLEASGVVSSVKVGRVRTCHLEVTTLATVQDWIEARRQGWERRLDRLGDFLAAHPEPAATEESRTHGGENMSSIEHATFTIERTYPASPERVFNAWAVQEVKTQWFGGDGDVDMGSVGEHTLDFRVGGREHLRGTIPGGGSVTMDALYQDIVDGQRIVWSYEMHIDARRISVSVATVEIIGVPGGAQLVLTEQGAFLDGLDNNDQRREGTEFLLNQLGNYLGAAS